jgi:hypothetical protein
MALFRDVLKKPLEEKGIKSLDDFDEFKRERLAWKFYKYPSMS